MDSFSWAGSANTSQWKTSDRLVVDRHVGTARFGDGKGRSVNFFFHRLKRVIFHSLFLKVPLIHSIMDGIDIYFKLHVKTFIGDFFQLAGDRTDGSGQLKLLKVAGKEGNLLKLGKVKSEVSDVSLKFGRGSSADAHESATQEHTRILLGKRNSGGNTAASGSFGEVRGSKELLGRPSERRLEMYDEGNDDYGQTPGSHLPKDSKPLLRFKFKKPPPENQNSSLPEEERSSIKGQRSKRRRPSPLEKTSHDVTPSQQENLMDEIMDANWILKKLGKDAIGKRVEVHQLSDNSW